MQFITVLLYILLAITSLFLICLVLIQRGKGGGLAGAFGGAGGSSAFGTKAGDVFTRVTMITAGIWIALNMLLVVISNQPSLGLAEPPRRPRSDFTPAKRDPARQGRARSSRRTQACRSPSRRRATGRAGRARSPEDRPPRPCHRQMSLDALA